MSIYSLELVKSEHGIAVGLGEELVRGESVSPFTVLLHAIGSCSVFVFQSLLEQNGIDYEFVNAYCSGESIDRKAANVRIEIHMRVAEESQAKALRLSHKIKDFCTIVRSLDPNIDVVELVVFD